MEHAWPSDELLRVEVVRAQETSPWTPNRTQQSWVALLLKNLTLTFSRVWKTPFPTPPLPLFEHSRDKKKEKEAIFPGGDEWGDGGYKSRELLRGRRLPLTEELL